MPPESRTGCADCIDEWWLISTEGARGTTSAALAARIAPQIKVRLNESHSIAAACAAASAAAGPADRIVVFGSFHTVGPAMDWLEARGCCHRRVFPNILRRPMIMNKMRHTSWIVASRNVWSARRFWWC